MPREFKRTDRVAEEIKDLLANIMHKAMRDDEQYNMITLTDVEVSRDLSHAKVFVSILDDLIQKTDTPPSSSDKIKRLNDKAPYLRSLLAKQMRIRKVPELTFIYDDTLIKGNELMHLIHKANKS